MNQRSSGWRISCASTCSAVESRGVPGSPASPSASNASRQASTFAGSAPASHDRNSSARRNGNTATTPRAAARGRCGMARQQRREQRRQRPRVQHVVAEVGERATCVPCTCSTSPSGWAYPPEQPGPLGLRDDLRARQRHDDQPRRVRRGARELAQQVEVADQLRGVHRVARRASIATRDQVDRIDDDRVVDPRDDLERERVDRLAPRRVGLRDRRPRHARAWSSPAPRRRRARARARAAAPCAAMNGPSAIGSPTFTCTRPKCSRACAANARGRAATPSASAARQLGDVGVALEQPLVADVDRHEHQRPVRRAQPALDGHREQSRLRPPACGRCGCGRPRRSTRSGSARAIIACRYSANTAAYSASPRKLRRRKNARRPGASRPPTTGRFRFAPAATCGAAALVVDQERQQQVVDVAAVAGHVDHRRVRRDRGSASSRVAEMPS